MGSTAIHTDYLRDLCATCSQKTVELRPSPLGGLGGFATVRIPKDQVIFAIPRDLILSSSAPAVLHVLENNHHAADGPQQYHRISRLAQDARITAETLLCADMVWNENASSSKASYLMSLLAATEDDYSTQLLVASELNGTNVGSQLLADQTELLTQHAIIQELLPDSDITIAELTRARAIYNSRRYPLRFALTTNTTFAATTYAAEAVASGIASMAQVDVDDDDASTGEGSRRVLKKSKVEEEEASPPPSAPARRVYDPTQGCLCPLLDVLNHQSGNDYCLQFNITPTTLYVIANHDIEKGNEVYSNYDCENNDQCLLQFGFVMSSSSSSSFTEADYKNDDATNNDDHHQDDDDMDVFTVQVACKKFYLRARRDIPQVLLSDGGYGLEQHFIAKQTAQANATLSSNPFVQEYMKSQRQLLLVLMEKVRRVIEDNEQAEEEDEEEEADSGDEGCEED